MSLDIARSDLTLGIVGTGLMVRGIAQIAAQGGVNVLLFDARGGAALEARKFIQDTLERLVEKGKISSADAADAVERIRVLEDLAGLAPCHIVIEAILENLEVKRQLFQSVEGIVADDCLLASNTSSLSVTAI